MKLRISGAARRDLDAIGVYIAKDNPVRAIGFVAELSATIRTAAERPMSFPARDDLGLGVRSASHRPYLILFRIAGDCVEIVKVIHGARDLPNIM